MIIIFSLYTIIIGLLFRFFLPNQKTKTPFDFAIFNASKFTTFFFFFQFSRRLKKTFMKKQKRMRAKSVTKPPEAGEMPGNFLFSIFPPQKRKKIHIFFSRWQKWRMQRWISFWWWRGRRGWSNGFHGHWSQYCNGSVGSCKFGHLPQHW